MGEIRRGGRVCSFSVNGTVMVPSPSPGSPSRLGTVQLVPFRFCCLPPVLHPACSEPINTPWLARRPCPLGSPMRGTSLSPRERSTDWIVALLGCPFAQMHMAAPLWHPSAGLREVPSLRKHFGGWAVTWSVPPCPRLSREGQG